MDAEPRATVGDRRKVYAVGELARLIRTVLENEIGAVWIEGEISNLHVHSSGHVYFTLKDADAQIQAALFRGAAQAARLKLADGAKVRVFGEITAYAARSQYQVIVRALEPAGRGSLQEQFEKLKERLKAEGLFEAARKRPLPLLPRHLGIVTSPTGAAIRDMLTVLGRRFPNLHVVIAPVKVQGEGAAAEIAAALDLFNARGGLDVLIVGRGGGSLEDLWAFNEEAVARAIARSGIPVISAVGHETDFTISDFVADVRAATPSAAAELVVGRKDEFEERLRALERRVGQALRTRALSLRSRLARAAHSYVFREPQNLLARHRERIGRLGDGARHAARNALALAQQRADELAMRLRQAPPARLRAWAERLVRAAGSYVFREPSFRTRRLRERLDALRGALRDRVRPATGPVRRRADQLALRLRHAAAQALQARRLPLGRLESQVAALDPLAVLERGYSVTRDARGAILRDAAGARAGDRLETRLARGRVLSTVTETQKEPAHGRQR